MRPRNGVVLAALLLLTGCGEQTTDKLKAAVRRYFAQLNADAAGTRADTAHSGAGLVFSVYSFSPDGLIVALPCTKCGVEQDVVNYDGKRVVLCARCGEKLLDKDMNAAAIEARKGKALPMFKSMSEAPPIKAEVRYVRREYYWDENGKIDLESQNVPEVKTGRTKMTQDLQQVSTKAFADVAAVKDAAEGVDKPGMHRHLATFIGRMEVELRNADVVVTSGPEEQPVRNWLFPLNPYTPIK